MKTKKILIGIGITIFALWFVFLLKDCKTMLKERENSLRDELLRKDSIIQAKEKIMQQQAEKVALLQLQYDSINILSDLRAKEIKKWKDKYKQLQDSLPTLTADEQVKLFINTFNIGSDYEGDFIAPVQAAYQSNKTWLHLEECNGLIDFKDGTIADLEAKDSISRIQLVIQQGITDTCLEALTVCKSKDEEWKELLKKEKKKGNLKGIIGLVGGVLVGKVL